MYQVALIPKEYVSLEWTKAEPFIAKAVERSRGRWTIGHVYNQAINGHTQLWFAFDEDKEIRGVGITGFMHYPGQTNLCVHWLGGTMFEEWFWPMINRFEDWAKDNGCAAVEAVARHGFWKFMSQAGYERLYTTYHKDLESDGERG
jgi:hypothetical protein